ncbi:MAG TPA: phosphoenolpyruvate carboxylase [Actinomycetota bacterium]|nr:phosphoenolpyruvate carboxylase [Actinomycetota bacterium]
MTRTTAEPDGRRGQPLPDAFRRDVRFLTTILGEVIAEDDPSLFRDVETLRRASIALRERPSPARRRRVESLVGAIDARRGEALARAFTAYFQLVNVAEERNRVRELRSRSHLGPLPDSLGSAVAEIRRRHGDPVEHLEQLELTEVLTAHPTEAKRRSVAECLWRIGELLERHDDPSLGRHDRDVVRLRLIEEITGLWGTDPIREHRPEPLDEVRATVTLFDQTIFRLVPQLVRETEHALRGDDAGTAPALVEPFVRWATWVGGDRDGNPAVTAEVTRETLDIQRDHVLRGYEAAARRIARGLSVSEGDVPPSRALRAALARDGRAMPEPAAELERKLPDAPHRRRLVLVAARILATRLGRPGGYVEVDDLVADIEQVQTSLARGGAPRLAYGEVEGLRAQVRTFGFHLASVEVRQHAEILRAAVDELIPSAAGDARALDRIATGRATKVRRPRSDATRELVATFRMMRDAQRRLGRDACRRFIVSFTRDPVDLTAVTALARVACGDDPPDLHVVPLLESSDELAHATDVLDGWLALPGARRALRARGQRLEVMIGYSDSAKEIGPLAANLALYAAQRSLSSWARERGIVLTIFHGRGGALGRGGGPTNRAILGQPPGSIDGRFKVTEQGEVAFARYGHLEVARRHVEQLANAVVLASARHDAGDAADRFSGEIATMASASEDAWRRLLADARFTELFRRATPMRQIASMRIASRPVSRWGADDLEQLRAIPWVFAWGQSRVNLTGWFGVGTGLEAVGDVDVLRRIHAGWPFFRVLLENVELSLAKADRAIADRYLARAPQPELAAAILDEFDRTERLVLEVTGRDRVLAGRPALREAVDLRNPYVDALSFLQLRFLDERGVAAERIVQATIAGVAAGLQNTG